MSNFAVLAVMVAIMGVAAVGMQLCVRKIRPSILVNFHSSHLYLPAGHVSRVRRASFSRLFDGCAAASATWSIFSLGERIEHTDYPP